MTADFLLRHFIGFSLQLMPATLLLLLAFGPLSWRLPTNRLYTLFITLDMGLAAIFAICAQIIWLRSPGMDGGSFLFGNGYMLLSIVMCAALYFYLNREPPMRKLYLFFMVVSFAAAQFALSNALLLFSAPAQGMAGQVYMPNTLLSFLAVTAVILPPAAAFFKRSVRIYLKVST